MTPDDLVTWASMVGVAAFSLVLGVGGALWMCNELFDFSLIGLWRERSDRRLAELRQREATARAEAETKR